MRERVAQTRTQPTAFVRADEGVWLGFTDPKHVLMAIAPGDVAHVIADVERLTREQLLHAVGFLTYEAGQAFGVPARSAGEDRFPLAWFAFFERERVVNREALPPVGEYSVGPLQPTLDFPAFSAAFDRIKAHLSAGDSYQANLTFKMRGPFAGDALALFSDLTDAQRGRYSVFIDTGEWCICSASPELFFQLDGLEIVARPMKGTSKRGRTAAEDRERAEILRTSPKQQAENVMIVDMMRNDIGRIADVGSVSVPELFSLERYPTVWQLTSTVRARTTARLEAIFAALHPSASVTGAPKRRTVQILSALEREPRGVYTGAIGHVPPDGNAVFNVGIRTAVVDRQTNTISFGVGSGIVWDSEAEDEYAECLLKGQVLGARREMFDLLETLRWDPSSGYFLLERHLSRLAESAEFFSIPVNLREITKVLDTAIADCSEPQRVRLLVSSDGAARAERTRHQPRPGTLAVALAGSPVDKGSVWLYHKTTRRAVYDDWRSCFGAEYDDVLLWNTDDEVTEATLANIVVELDGRKVTPPVSCGLLAGTYRAEMLERGMISEGVIRRSDLSRATGIWLMNSVHEMRPALLKG